jgi:hypothetical protein
MTTTIIVTYAVVQGQGTSVPNPIVSLVCFIPASSIILAQALMHPHTKQQLLLTNRFEIQEKIYNASFHSMYISKTEKQQEQELLSVG